MLRRCIAVVFASIVLAGAAVPAAGGSVLVKATFSSTGTPTYKPRRTEISPGTRVVWKAVVGTHTVTSYSHNWSKDVTLAQGDTTGFRFNSTGVFKFRCRFHSTLSSGVCSGMCGKIVVVG